MGLNGERKAKSLEDTMRRHIRMWEQAGIIPPLKELLKKHRMQEKMIKNV